MKKFILYLIVFHVLFSCKQEKEREILIIDPSQAENENIHLSELASDISYISLSNDKLFNRIQNIDRYSNIWFVQTDEYCICLYDQNGKLINKIDHKGRGPNEYQYINSFTVDEKNEIIYILSRGNVLAYDYSDNFIRSFSVDIRAPENIYFQENKLYLFSSIKNGINEKNWLVVDASGNEISKKLNFYKEPIRLRSAYATTPFYKYNDNICYWNILNDTIFSIKENEYSVRYLFGSGDFRITTEGTNLNENARYIVPFQIIETGNYLFLPVSFYGQHCMMVINKSKKESIISNTTELLNDFDGGLNLFPMQRVEIQSDEYLIGYIQSYDFISQVTSEAFKSSTPKYPDKKKQLEQLANSLDENDNPVLMLVKLKE